VRIIDDRQQRLLAAEQDTAISEGVAE